MDKALPYYFIVYVYPSCARVMTEELSQARAYYSLQCHDAHTALQQLLNERQELRTNLVESYKWDTNASLSLTLLHSSLGCMLSLLLHLLVGEWKRLPFWKLIKVTEAMSGFPYPKNNSYRNLQGNSSCDGKDVIFLVQSGQVLILRRM